MKLKKIDAVEIAVKALQEETLGPADKDGRRYMTADTANSVRAYERVLKIIKSVKNEQPNIITMPSINLDPEFADRLKEALKGGK